MTLPEILAQFAAHEQEWKPESDTCGSSIRFGSGKDEWSTFNEEFARRHNRTVRRAKALREALAGIAACFDDLDERGPLLPIEKIHARDGAVIGAIGTDALDAAWKTAVAKLVAALESDAL